MERRAHQGALSTIGERASVKLCIRCGQSRSHSDFYRDRTKADGLDFYCKPCRMSLAKQRYARNAERERASSLDRYHANPLPRRAAMKAWRQANRPNLREQNRNDYRTRAIVRLRQAVSVGVRKALKGERKSSGWMALLGYSISDLRSHLEALFLPGMTWANYGSAWHIDHRRPVKSFDLPSQLRECWALSNLQPLWAIDNLRKGSRWGEPQ